jgi:hypothetical protein
MLNLALWLKRNGFRLDQVQTFLPTPMALATAMYHTEKNPLRKVTPRRRRPVGVVRGGRQRKLHKAFLRYHDPENWPLLREALRRMGRADLIGNGDFDVWFFYPFNQTHLPYRTIWNWDYQNPKFGHRAAETGYFGRRVDVLVRSIHVSPDTPPVFAVQEYLERGASSSAKALAQKAVVMLYPESERGRVVWYRKRILSPCSFVIDQA